MNIFQIHRDILKDYSEYINSFIDIKDELISNTVTEQISSGKLWPEPLIQFNPSYQPGESVRTLCEKGVLNGELENLFNGYSLYRHQVEALELGATRKSFIVTSGTGSGKSLVFLGTIFNYLFSAPAVKGIKALIVYPMNALINSQTQEIDKYREIYEKNTGREFPFTFKQYTGQENKEERVSYADNDRFKSWAY